MDHRNFNAVAFVATSAEHRALCIQTYQLARFALQRRLESGLYKSPCVVMDLDETVLDNIKYQAWLIQSGQGFTDPTWDAWCLAKQAGLVPGAAAFVEYARSLGTELIFITSRAEKTRAATVENLVRLGVLLQAEAADYASTDTAKTKLFMKGMPEFTDPLLEEKFAQREFVQDQRGYEIVLSVGDSLTDYAAYYKSFITALTIDPQTKKYPERKASPTERRYSADQDSPQWGVDFVVIPNPTYGQWERALSKDAAISEQGQTDPAADRIPSWSGPPAAKPAKKK